MQTVGPKSILFAIAPPVLQAVMVLVFMFAASWRLTVVTFVLVPCVLVISKVRNAVPTMTACSKSMLAGRPCFPTHAASVL